jgi:hypothetical protein
MEPDITLLGSATDDLVTFTDVVANLVDIADDDEDEKLVIELEEGVILALHLSASYLVQCATVKLSAFESIKWSRLFIKYFAYFSVNLIVGKLATFPFGRTKPLLVSM